MKKIEISQPEHDSPLLKAQCSSYDQLLLLFDEPFVEAAYQTLLLRKADPSGTRYYGQRLRLGHSRISVLDQLLKSSETREDWDSISGLKEALRQHRASRRLSGWRKALFDPEFGKTPAIRRTRSLQNSIGAERQLLQQSMRELTSRHMALERLLIGLAETVQSRPDEQGIGETRMSTFELRPRDIREVREVDLPQASRRVLSQFRF